MRREPVTKHGRGACPYCGHVVTLTPELRVWYHKIRTVTASFDGPRVVLGGPCPGSWELAEGEQL